MLDHELESYLLSVYNVKLSEVLGIREMLGEDVASCKILTQTGEEFIERNPTVASALVRYWGGQLEKRLKSFMDSSNSSLTTKELELRLKELQNKIMETHYQGGKIS